VRRRGIEARSQFEEEEDQNTDLFSVSKLTRSIQSCVDLLVRISESNSGNHPNFFIFHRKKLNEGLQSQINGESKKDFEKDSKKFEQNPKNVNHPRFTVYFINLGSNP
jgi:hypothetical protein